MGGEGVGPPWMSLFPRFTEPLLDTSPEMELLFLRRLQDVRAEEGQDVCLEVETGRIDKAGAVRWVRGGEPLQADSRLSMAQESHIHRLVIHSVMLNDQGIYGCESHHDRTLARLSVRREYPIHPGILANHTQHCQKCLDPSDPPPLPP